jgi:GAF domain-containing protein
VGLALFDETRQHLRVRADHPAPGNQSTVGADLPLAGNLSVQRVLETRRPLMVLDAQHDPLMSHVQPIMERQQVQSVLLVPLIVRDEVIGTIGVDVLHAPRVFSEEEIDLARPWLTWWRCVSSKPVCLKPSVRRASKRSVIPRT